MQNFNNLKIPINFVDYAKKHILLCLFFLFFVLYFTVGLYLCFFNKAVTNCIDLIFDMDSSFAYNLVASNMLQINILYKHSFIVIIIKPFLMLATAFFNSARVGGLFLQAIIGSGTVCLIYSIINVITNRKNIAVFLALLYGLSISTIIFSSVYEFYIYSAFISTLLLYYVCVFWNKNIQLNIFDYILMAVILLCSFGITPITCISNLTLIFLLFIRKKQSIKSVFSFLFIFVVLFILYSLLLKFGYFPFMFGEQDNHIKIFYQIHNNFNRFLLAIKSLYIESFYGLKIEIGNLHDVALELYKQEGIFFAEKQPFGLYIPSLCLISTIVWGLIKNIKNIKSSILLPLIVIVIINFLEFYIFNTKYSFLFSQNTLPFLVVLIGVLYNKFSDKFVNIFCSLFILWQCICNFYTISFIEKYVVKKTIDIIGLNDFNHFDIWVWILYSLIISVILGVIFFIIRKATIKDIWNLSSENKIRIFTVMAFIYMILVSIFTVLFRGMV